MPFSRYEWHGKGIAGSFRGAAWQRGKSTLSCGKP
jgi:hypothetical protein